MFKYVDLYIFNKHFVIMQYIVFKDYILLSQVLIINDIFSLIH